MAFTVTDRGTFDVTYATSASSASFTPAANALLLVWAQMSDNTDLTSITGHGATFSAVNKVLVNSLSGLTLWVGKAQATPAADTLDITFNSKSATFGVIEVTGHNETLSAAAAVIQNQADSGYYAGSTPHALTLTMSAFASSTNLSMVFMGTPNSPENFFAEATWTEAQNSASTGPRDGLVAYKTSEDTSITVNTNSNYVHIGGIGIEIAEAASGPSITDIDGNDSVTLDQQNIVITGSDFEAEGANSRFTLIDGNSNEHHITSFDAWATGEITLDFVTFDNLPGSKFPIGACTARVRNQSLATGDRALAINDGAGYTSVTLASPGSDSDTHLAAIFTPNLATSDILYHETVSGLTVNADSTFTHLGAGQVTFQCIARDNATGEWGDIANVTVEGSTIVAVNAGPNQSARQTTYRLSAGTSSNYNEDAIAAYKAQLSNDAGTFNELQIRYIQSKLTSSKTNLMDLKAEAAEDRGVSNWGELRTDVTDIGS